MVASAESFPSLFFFFQAEDGIRATSVTGVQTCALPISASHAIRASAFAASQLSSAPSVTNSSAARLERRIRPPMRGPRSRRSEERRVGKECKRRWCPQELKTRRRVRLAEQWSEVNQYTQ